MVLNGIVWTFRTGSAWRDMPERYGSRATLHTRQLGKAHARAREVHLAARLRKGSPFGSILAEAVREELAVTAQELGEAVRVVRGYDHAINDHALFP